jgi:DNA-binding response OmpR family regulator
MMMRILIVEDEEHLADLLAEVLGREGHVAKTASDGRSGLTRALSENFDLLVVDWMLPDLSTGPRSSKGSGQRTFAFRF